MAYRISFLVGLERCCGGTEDPLHAVRDCTPSKQDWDSLLPSAMASTFYHNDTRDWVLSNLKHREDEGRMLPLPKTWAITVWFLWKCRNGDALRNERLPLGMKMDIIRSTVADTYAVWNGVLLETSGFNPSSKEHHLM